MNPRRLFSLAILALSFTITPHAAAADYPGHEVWFGLGGATSFENDIFNVQGDLESSPELAISLGYMKNLDARQAVGFHVYGATETTPAFVVQGPSGSQIVNFELDTFNIGVRYRLTFSRGSFAPYAFAGASWASGSIDAPETGELTCSGISGCVGPGAAVKLARHLMLSAEVFGSFGVARWESEPFLNSSGKEFNPSLVSGTVNLSFVWGWQ